MTNKQNENNKIIKVDFQKKNNLTVDGEFGSKSLAKAKAIVK